MNLALSIHVAVNGPDVELRAEYLHGAADGRIAWRFEMDPAFARRLAEMIEGAAELAESQ